MNIRGSSFLRPPRINDISVAVQLLKPPRICLRIRSGSQDSTATDISKNPWRFLFMDRHGYVEESVAVSFEGSPQIMSHPRRFVVFNRHGCVYIRDGLADRHGYVPHIRDH